MIQSVGEREFRLAMGTFATGVGVVTCRSAGRDHAMTANAITSVSLRPPLILVAVARTNRFWQAVSSQTHWAVSILTVAAQEHARWLATSGRPLVGQLDRVPHRRTDRGIAILEQSLAWLECRTEQIVPAGDHDVLIGAVESLTLAPAEPQAAALVYWRSQYRRLDR